MKRDEHGGLWVKPEDNIGKVNYSSNDSISELYVRYGHISFDTLKTLPECLKFDKAPRYKACEKEKATKPLA